VEFVATDLKKMGATSPFYRDSDKWVQIEPNIRVRTRGRLEVSYYSWPVGPFSILDVETGRWRYEE